MGNTHNEARRIKSLYLAFLKEHGVTTQTVYANILWLWPEYIKAHSANRN